MVRTEVDERRGGRARRRQRAIVSAHQALGDTLKHTHSFTHTDTAVHAHGRVPLPTATPTCAGITEGSPVFSPVQGVAADRSPRPESYPDLQALPGSQNAAAAPPEARRRQQRLADLRTHSRGERYISPMSSGEYLMMDRVSL